MPRLALPLALFLLLSACSLPATRPAAEDMAADGLAGVRAAPAVGTCPAGDDDGIGGTGCQTD